MSQKKMSRRTFVCDAGIAAGVAALAASMTPASRATADEMAQRVTEELPVPEVAAPEKTQFDCDVLVIGGGFAGLNAAMAAKAAGAEVVLLDKGRPGYSGLSPWPSSHRWFDPEMGDDEESCVKCVQLGAEYVSNLNSYREVWIKHSKEAFERMRDWGLFDRFDRCADTEYWDTLDYQGYRDSILAHDRHKRFCELLDENGIEWLDYVMVTDVVVEDGRVQGAAGFHVPSGSIVTVNAKAVIMAMGGGCYKPSGYPVGGNTFDGEYIAYELGLPIIGKEYDDFHGTSSLAPGLAFMTSSWDWLENIWLCGGDMTPEGWENYAINKQRTMVINRVADVIDGVKPNDGVSNIEDQANGSVDRRGGSASGNPDDIRIGKFVSPKPKGDLKGGAIGMHAHFTCGVWCGFDDTEGFTGIDGLYVAGDGINGTSVTGADYPVGVGFTSNYTSCLGDLSGKAAAAYAQGVELVPLAQQKIDEITESIMAPMSLEKGFSPDWVRDQLQAIMSPWWVSLSRDEASLQSALTQVEQLRDKVVPKIMATNPHQLRLAIEDKHKVQSAEMKLRAQLARTESRGTHYRSDYPFRDDENWLCYQAVRKAEDGSMVIDKIPVPQEMVGDLSVEYQTRYPNRFPGEADALGLPVEEQAQGSGWGR